MRFDHRRILAPAIARPAPLEAVFLRGEDILKNPQETGIIVETADHLLVQCRDR